MYFLTMVSVNARVLTAVSAAATYAVLFTGLELQWAWLEAADTWVLHRFHDYGAGSPGWVGFWQAVSTVLGPSALRGVALAGIGVALVRRKARVAAFLALSVLGMGLVTVAAKAISERPRPATALAFEPSTAFPSGHAMGIAVAVLAFATVAWPVLSRGGKAAAVGGGTFLVVLVGLSRVALNVHHPSDVLAGWALGYLWYLVCLAVAFRTGARRSRSA